MDKYCSVTIDTEPDCDVYWNRSNPLTFSSVLIGIPRILRPIWNKYSVNPIYFVSPEVVENIECCKVLKHEVELGAEIGAHLHSEYIEPNKKYHKYDGTSSNEYPCFAYSKEVEKNKIENLTNLIIKNIGVKPVSYRAARYGADLDTIRSLKSLGYKVDSSVTPEIDWSKQGGPNHKNAPNHPYYISNNNYCSPTLNNKNILEMPITIKDKRLGFLGKYLPNNWLFYNWLRPTHMFVWGQKNLINKIIKEHDKDKKVVINMMFHSMEIIPKKTPFVRGILDQKLYLQRLKDILKYLKQNNFVFATFKDLLKNNAKF